MTFLKNKTIHVWWLQRLQLQRCKQFQLLRGNKKRYPVSLSSWSRNVSNLTVIFYFLVSNINSIIHIKDDIYRKSNQFEKLFIDGSNDDCRYACNIDLLSQSLFYTYHGISKLIFMRHIQRKQSKNNNNEQIKISQTIVSVIFIQVN